MRVSKMKHFGHNESHFEAASIICRPKKNASLRLLSLPPVFAVVVAPHGLVLLVALGDAPMSTVQILI